MRCSPSRARRAPACSRPRRSSGASSPSGSPTRRRCAPLSPRSSARGRRCAWSTCSHTSPHATSSPRISAGSTTRRAGGRSRPPGEAPARSYFPRPLGPYPLLLFGLCAPLEVLEGLRQLALQSERQAQVGVGKGIVRLDAQGLLEMFDRLGELALLGELNAPVGVGKGVARLDAQ